MMTGRGAMAEAVNWDDALAELQRLARGATAFLSADRVARAADAVAGPARWERFPDWEDVADLDILDRVFAGRPPLHGPLLLATAHMGFRGSPVRLPAERLRQFVAEYRISAGECFFNGDVVILAPEARRLTVFHHEGAFAHWHFGAPVAEAGVRPEPGAAADRPRETP
jgi:hypothetical protein